MRSIKYFSSSNKLLGVSRNMNKLVTFLKSLIVYNAFYILLCFHKKKQISYRLTNGMSSKKKEKRNGVGEFIGFVEFSSVYTHHSLMHTFSRFFFVGLQANSCPHFLWFVSLCALTSWIQQQLIYSIPNSVSIRKRIFRFSALAMDVCVCVYLYLYLFSLLFLIPSFIKRLLKNISRKHTIPARQFVRFQCLCYLLPNSIPFLIAKQMCIVFWHCENKNITHTTSFTMWKRGAVRHEWAKLCSQKKRMRSMMASKITHTHTQMSSAESHLRVFYNIIVGNDKAKKETPKYNTS